MLPVAWVPVAVPGAGWQDKVASVAIESEGAAYAEAGRGSTAIAVYSEALRVDPYNMDARLLRGRLYLEQAEPDFAAALEDFQVYCRVHPGQAAGWEALGDAALLDGRYALAGEAARRLLELEGGEGLHRLRLVRALIGEGYYAEAAELAVKTISPKYRFADGGCAECYVLGWAAWVLAGNRGEAELLARRGLNKALPAHWTYPVLRHLEGLSGADTLIGSAGGSELAGGYREKALFYAGMRAIGRREYTRALALFEKVDAAGRPACAEWRLAQTVAGRVGTALERAGGEAGHGPR